MAGCDKVLSFKRNHRDARNRGEEFLVLFVTLCCVLSCCVCFNIDTEHPVVLDGPPGSLFGYSVGILPTSNSSWILVGAPQAEDTNVPDIQRPGALYKCSTEYPYRCDVVEVHSKGNIKQTVRKWKNITLYHGKNDQWLGASLDINFAGDMSVVVCAPRWRNREYHVQGHDFMNGLCYESGRDLQFKESSVWPVLEFFKKQIHPTGFYVYGMGSLGTSVRYSKDGRFLLMGAPGVNDWTGGFAKASNDHKSRPKVVQPDRLAHNNSYLGYSITSARLSSDAIFTVVGGPRADNKGKVLVYNENHQVMLTKEGEQFGSYFGASVLAMDLNGDKLDELIIGAPMYTEQFDEGRVYVYINNEFFNLEPIASPLKGSNSQGSRFGTAVASLGDVNNDGFGDLAVGAPFEGDSGVVYIYNGEKRGIHMDYSQRIVGSDVRETLRGFGWSISRPHDIDGNKYKDVVIGAYASDSAVLLAARPVINLRARLDIDPRVIDPDASTHNCLYRGHPTHCFKAVACFIYFGEDLPKTQKLSFTMSLDTLPKHRKERQRVFVRDRNGIETEVVEETITLRAGSWNCGTSYTVFTKKSRDIVTPLQYDLNYTLFEDKSLPPCQICPITNAYSNFKISETARFLKDCSSDDICQTDLVLDAKVLYDNNEKFWILDESPSFEVQVQLNNIAELAYLTVVRFRYPQNIRYSRVKSIIGSSEIICLSKKNVGQNITDVMECDISQPLRSREEIIFTVRFLAAEFAFDLRKFDIVVEVETASTDLNLKNNRKTVTIEPRIKTSLSLTGAAIPGQIEVQKKKGDESGYQPSGFEMKHVFDIRNHGPSPFPHGYLVVLLPNSKYISVQDIEIDTGDPDYSINSDCSTVTTPSFDPPRASFKLTKYSSMDEKPDLLKQKRLICSPKECINITCTIGTMEKRRGVYVTVTFHVDRSILRDLNVEEKVEFVSSVLLIEPQFPSYISLTENNDFNVTTFIVPEQPVRKYFQMWVLAVTIVGGLLLFYLICLLLWMSGFFRRKKREELRKLMKAAETERIANITSQPVSDVNDVMILPPNNNFFLNDLMSTETTTFTHLNNHNHHWSQPPAFNNDSYLQPVNMRS